VSGAGFEPSGGCAEINAGNGSDGCFKWTVVRGIAREIGRLGNAGGVRLVSFIGGFSIAMIGSSGICRRRVSWGWD